MNPGQRQYSRWVVQWRMSRAAELVSVAVWSSSSCSAAVWVTVSTVVFFLPDGNSRLNSVRIAENKKESGLDCLKHLTTNTSYLKKNKTKIKYKKKKRSNCIWMTMARTLCFVPQLVLWVVKVHEELKVNSIFPWSSSCSSCSCLSRFCLCFQTFSCLVLHASGRRIPGFKKKKKKQKQSKLLLHGIYDANSILSWQNENY